MGVDGAAEGDLFYDDGESTDTIGGKSYYYATYKWSTSDNRLIINVIENNYPEMLKKTLDTLTIYGLANLPNTFVVNQKEIRPTKRANTDIVDVTGLGLSMSESYTLTWTTQGTTTVKPPPTHSLDIRHRVDCHPDPGK